MRHGLLVAGAVWLAACADPSAEWVGSYEGTLTTVEMPCNTSDAQPASAVPLVAEVEVVDGATVITGGACPFVLETDGTTARVSPCEADIGDGLEVTGGSAEVDGDELSFDVSYRFTFGGGSICNEGRSTFVGTRL